MEIILRSLVLSLVFYGKTVSATNSAFDPQFYKDALDPEECDRQLAYIRNNDTLLRLRLMDASWRVPKSLLKGNVRDLGNYFQCININENIEIEEMNIGGKYCVVKFPTDQKLPTLPDLPWPDTMPDLPWEQVDPENDYFFKQMGKETKEYEKIVNSMELLTGNNQRTEIAAGFTNTTFELAVCVPKVCTTRQALDFFSDNVTSFMDFEDFFCRLPNDKNWVAADTIAIVLLSTIGFITILSSAYDIRHTVLLERDPKKANQLYQSFSIYTNTKNFFVFPSGAGVITCIDGIRSIAMIWVIVGHTFVTLSGIVQNPLDTFHFMKAFSSLWITSATITVDTFFVLSGLLVVYISAAKMSSITLVKNLHLFYLNRLLRMFPVLAFGILMTASFMYRTVDGPYFRRVANFVNNCRNNWWSTLLYVQNFVNPLEMCVPHGWYLAIDMQLHFLSPVVLFWVLGTRKRVAWSALVTALVGVLIAASVYNFINNFQSGVVALSRPQDGENYMVQYYMHTLPRASPFFVGMIFGYLLHLYRERKPRMPMSIVMLLWALALSCTSGVMLTTYWNIQPEWDNQLMDNILNSYKRPLWGAGIGWIVFACHNGLGGPVNWVLSLHAFKILGRLSYAMYILHYPLMYLINATNLAPFYFTTYFALYRFMVDFSIALIAAFLVTIFIDMPFSNLIKMGMELVSPAKKRPQKVKPSLTKEDPPMKSMRDDLGLDVKSLDINENDRREKLH